MKIMSIYTKVINKYFNKLVTYSIHTNTVVHYNTVDKTNVT